MKFRKDKDIIKLLGFSFGVILTGIFILQFIPQIDIIGVFSISSGLVGLLIGLRLASKPKDYFLQDERSVRIREKAGYHSYGIMSLMAVIIWLLSLSKLSASLTPLIANGVLFIWFIGSYSFLILNWYYNKKGE